MVLKRCNACKDSKPLDDFHLKPHGKFGRNGRCKECRKKYGRRRYQRNSRRIIKQVKIWQKNNPVKYRLQMQRWYQRHKRRLSDLYIRRILLGQKITPTSEAIVNTRIRLAATKTQFLMQLSTIRSILSK